MCKQKYVYIFVCMYVCMCVCVRTYVCMYVRLRSEASRFSHLLDFQASKYLKDLRSHLAPTNFRPLALLVDPPPTCSTITGDTSQSACVTVSHPTQPEGSSTWVHSKSRRLLLFLQQRSYESYLQPFVERGFVSYHPRFPWDSCLPFSTVLWSSFSIPNPQKFRRFPRTKIGTVPENVGQVWT